MNDLVVLGAGPAGLTAGLYGARAGLKTRVLETKSPGGQILLTDHILNYPGFPDGITGRDLAGLFHRQAEKYGCRITTRVGTVGLSNSETGFSVSTLNETCQAKTVVIATGGAPRRLNAPGEKKLSGAGIS